MKNDRFQIQNKLQEIENKLNLVAGQLGVSSKDILLNPIGKPLEVLEPMLGLVREKLQLQKTLYNLNGGDLSNVVLMNERKINVY